ncbi:AmmeMemoRadiSam system protein B [candidate division CSSED10-310 bacterium]|uniref:MEMO1 family protein ACFL27_13690 n=1 Tax=candidate division CSSED10-310 bacterium TaxID=2855610 RepID=A0ABV6YYG9_UNCC1
MKRKAAVANQFYEGDPRRLEKQLDTFFEPGLEQKKVIAVVSPHAGYIYSGKVAGAVFSRINPASTYVILGPNHRGFGSSVGIMSAGSWEMPWGEVSINHDLATNIGENSPLVSEDEFAHQFEHSLEVQVPFINRISPQATIVPISLSIRDYNPCEEIGHALATAISDYGEVTTIVASTDMSHYEPHEVAKRKDQPAIDAIVALEPKKLFDYVKKHRVSMCGVIPTVITLLAAKELGAVNAELILYMTSGETSGDYHQVVGYAGLCIS